MKARTTIIVLALALSGCAANGGWTKRDTALEITWQVVNAMDAYSTANIHESPDWHPVTINGVNYLKRVEEHTPLTRSVLGPRPDPGETYMWFLTMGLSHWAISRALPPKWRPWFQGTTTAISADAVIGNCDRELC